MSPRFLRQGIGTGLLGRTAKGVGAAKSLTLAELKHLMDQANASGVGAKSGGGGTTVSPANPTAQVGPAAINGTAATFMRSDAAPKLADTAVTPGTFGDGTHYPLFTVDQQGRLTAASQLLLPAAVLLGSGAPTALEPAGTLYSRTDAAGVYTSQPIAAASSVVQHTHVISGSTGVGSITLGSTPSLGNLVIVFISWGEANVAQPTIDATKWTQFITDTSGGNVPCFAVYRYVQAGDTASLPAITTSGSAYWAATVYEIAGLTGTFSTDVESIGHTHVNATTISLSGATVSNYALVLTHAGEYNAFNNPSITGTGTWTLDESAWNNSNFGSVGCAHQQFVSGGTSFSLTWNMTNSDLGTTAMFAVLYGNAGGLTAKWVLVGP
jgi:hypothetical protein